jgi:ribonuclease BN (tRNA processing enzyme)
VSDAPALDLAVLGSGNAFAGTGNGPSRTPARCWSGFVLNGRYMFDAPPTALYGMKKMGLAVERIDTILISHFHADHFFGLPFLLLEYAYQTRRSTDLTIVGPPGIEDRVRRLTEIGYQNLLPRLEGFQLRFREVEDGCEGEVNGLRFSAIQVDHGGPEMRSFGFRAGVDGRTVAYTGDSRYCPQLLDLGRSVDVLVTDCTYARGFDQPEHMSLDEVRELYERLGGGTNLLLTHLGGDVDVSNMRCATVAEDGGRYRY